MATYTVRIYYLVTDEYPVEETEERTYRTKDELIAALSELVGEQRRPIYQAIAWMDGKNGRVVY